MRRVFILLFHLLLLPLAATTVSSNQPPRAMVPVIRSIDVKVNELFPGKKGFVKDAANALHVSTRKSVILRELLYRIGQPLDQRLVLESEKNLTVYLGFHVVKTHIKISADGKHADIVVEIQDIWSIYTNVKIEGGGGDLNLNLTFGDKNFLGNNQSLEFAFDKTVFHNHWKQSFKEPFFFGSRWRFEEWGALYYDQDANHVGEGVGLSLVYPLFSPASRWGLQLIVDYDRNHVYRTTGGSIDQVEVSPGVFYDNKYQKKKLGLTSLLTRRFGYDVKHEFSAGITLDRTGNIPVEDINPLYQQSFADAVLPSDRKRNYLKFGYTLDTSHLIRVRNFFLLDRPETYAIGFRLETMAGFSRGAWGSDVDSYLLSVNLRWSFFFGNNHILAFYVNGSTELFPDGTQQNGIFNASIYYWIRNLPLGFLAFRLRGDLGENLDQDNIFELGSGTGLRGYPANFYEGDRRLYFNIEYRFDPIKIGISRIGFLVFYDMGSCWYSSESDPRITLYPAVGVGLRFTFPSVNPNIFRFDFGYNFGNASRKFENMLSFGYNHVF